MMMRTGEFAKAAGVSEKTVRYYDKIGLLKPTRTGKNGYRAYSEDDLIRLQKIILFKQLDFSLDDIFRLLMKENDAGDIYQFQKELVRQKINSLQNLEDALGKVADCIKEDESIDAPAVMNLIRLSIRSSQTADNYRDSSYLQERISLHNKYSCNPESWYPWVLRHIDFNCKSRILEVGAGNGEMWRYCNRQMLRNREVFLTDKSEGMVDEVRNKLGREFNCIRADCTQIPFKDQYFDMVIANHVLFYLDDVDSGLKEICRVLKPGGEFYCTTYGRKHMEEITDLCTSFDKSIRLAEYRLSDVFGLENGKGILERYFSEVTLFEYRDHLAVEDADTLLNYILSCHGNQSEILLPRLGEFKDFVEAEIQRCGSLYITKQPVLFKCRL